MRLREDELFVRRITQDLPKGLKSNLRMVDLNLKDAPIRLRCTDDRVCETPVNPTDPAIEKIRKALTHQAELGAMEALVVPAALGNHVDHLTVREAAQPFTSERPAAFYEDLPYAATHATAAADLEALRAASPLKPGLCQADAAVERKHALVLGYASQIDAEAATLIINFVSRYNSSRSGLMLRSGKMPFACDRANSLHHLSIFLTNRRTVSVTIPYTTCVAISLVFSRIV
jgi:hypothetical protein